MRQIIIIILAGFLMGANEPAARFPDWIAGAWISQDGEQWSEEFWTPARGDLMIGAAKSGKADVLTSYEHMRIARDADGYLAFWAMPNGAPAVKFNMLSQTDSEIVFAKPSHDYPQKVRYWRDGTELRAEISMIDGGDAMQWHFRPMGG